VTDLPTTTNRDTRKGPRIVHRWENPDGSAREFRHAVDQTCEWCVRSKDA
jgi:hypothetical protein